MATAKLKHIHLVLNMFKWKIVTAGQGDSPSNKKSQLCHGRIIKIWVILQLWDRTGCSLCILYRQLKDLQVKKKNPRSAYKKQISRELEWIMALNTFCEVEMADPSLPESHWWILQERTGAKNHVFRQVGRAVLVRKPGEVVTLPECPWKSLGFTLQLPPENWGNPTCHGPGLFRN